MKKTKQLFDSWNLRKQKIELKLYKNKYLKVWEFWWYSEWVNVWFEISKDWEFTRPCLVLNKLIGNWLILICPITTKFNKSWKDCLLEIKDFEYFGLKRKSFLLINQIKFIDKRRFEERISKKKIKKFFIDNVLSSFIKKIKPPSL